jgi:hypothetical protein
MKNWLAALTLVVALGASGRADPLDNRQIPADAKWLFHVDVSAINAGTVSRRISDLWLERPPTSLQLRQLRRTTGVDPSKDLKGITIYGRSYKANGAVVILRSKVVQDRPHRYLRRRPDYQESQHGRHELMAWTEKKRRVDEHPMTACFFRPTLWVFARDIDDLKLALDVLDGNSPSLSQDNSLHAPAAPEGTVIQMRGTGLREAQLPFESPLVRKSTYLIALGGETSTEAFAEARMATESEEVAGQLRAVADGLLAMARLRFDKDPDALRMLDAVKVSAEEKIVSVECRWTAQELANLVEKTWTTQRNRK